MTCSGAMPATTGWTEPTFAGKDHARDAGVVDEALQPAPEDDALSDTSTNGSEASSSKCSTFSEGPSCAEGHPLGFSARETLLIFDWDDTILPTTWLGQEGLLDSGLPPNDEQANQLLLMAWEAEATLRAALARGDVAVVTNAGEGWVELSCRDYMPSLQPLLQGLQVISARTSYEQEGWYDPTGWKCRAFAQKLTEFYGGQGLHSKRQNVVSLGDSMYEREALMWATAWLPACRAKSLKFMERPSLQHMVEQHRVVAGCLAQVVEYDGPLDFEVEIPRPAAR